MESSRDSVTGFPSACILVLPFTYLLRLLLLSPFSGIRQFQTNYSPSCCWEGRAIIIFFSGSWQKGGNEQAGEASDDGGSEALRYLGWPTEMVKKNERLCGWAERLCWGFFYVPTAAETTKTALGHPGPWWGPLWGQAVQIRKHLLKNFLKHMVQEMSFLWLSGE